MSTPVNPELDLTFARVIRAPRAAVWQAWTDPRQLEKWWIPAPARCRVVDLELRPGGAFTTHMSENGGDFMPHVSGCFLAVEPMARLVFTTALVGGFRPGEPWLTMTANLAFSDHPEGMTYAAHVMHRSPKDRAEHDKLGFHEGWGTVAAQLARLVEEPR